MISHSKAMYPPPPPPKKSRGSNRVQKHVVFFWGGGGSSHLFKIHTDATKFTVLIILADIRVEGSQLSVKLLKHAKLDWT